MLDINKYKPTVEDIREDLSDDSDVFGVPTKSVQELAQQWGVNESEVADQLRAGIAIEKEHTEDNSLASEIARDHLKEDLYYYVNLAKMEGGKC